MEEKIKKIGSFVLRFGLSAVLLAWLFSRIDYKHTLSAIQEADKGYLVLAFFVFLFSCLLILWRWIIILQSLGLKFKKMSAARWFFIGQFCNLFLPTSVGGDVIKALGMSKETGHKPTVFISIVLDRLIGFVGIVLIAFASFLFGHHIIDDPSVFFSIVIMAVVSLGLGVVLFSRRIYTFACKVFSFWPKLKDALMNLHKDILLMRGKRKEFAAIMAISMFSQLVLAFDFYLVARGMHQEIDFMYFIIFSPLVCVVTALPSIGGLGVREIGWVYLLAKVGVHQGVALALSLISFAFMILVGLIGGVWYVATFSNRRVQHHQADSKFKQRNA